MIEELAAEDLQGLQEYFSTPLHLAGFTVARKDRRNGMRLAVYYKRRPFASLFVYLSRQVVLEIYGAPGKGPAYVYVSTTDYIRIRDLAQKLVDRKEADAK